MAPPRPRTSFDILAARAKERGSPFTQSKAMFFCQLQAFGLIPGGMGTTLAVAPGGALEAGPERVRFSGILPGFDSLQAIRNRKKNTLRVSADGNRRQLPLRASSGPARRNIIPLPRTANLGARNALSFGF
jgi:hypothetical protein